MTHPSRAPAERVRESPVLNVNDLMKGYQEIGLRHHGCVYRLRVTRNGKLLLTK